MSVEGSSSINPTHAFQVPMDYSTGMQIFETTGDPDRNCHDPVSANRSDLRTRWIHQASSERPTPGFSSAHSHSPLA